jgi:hypothetical protein
MQDEIKTGDYIGFDIGSGETMTVTGVFVTAEEFKRLKRLEENLNKKILFCKGMIETLEKMYSFCTPDRDSYQKLINELESLRDEKQPPKAV